MMGNMRHGVLMPDGKPDSGQVIRTVERIKVEGHMPRKVWSGRDGLNSGGQRRFSEEITLQLKDWLMRQRDYSEQRGETL